MNRGIKIILCLLTIVGLTLLTPLIIYNSQATVLSFPRMDLSYSLFIGPYVNLYLFWASVVLFVLLIVIFFIILFLPKKEKSVTVKDLNGELKIEKKSIESYVSANLEQAQFIAKPKIKVHMTKNKIDIKVLGRFKEFGGIIPSGEQLMTNIKADLQNLLGVTDKTISIVVDFVDYVETNPKKTRVE